MAQENPNPPKRAQKVSPHPLFWALALIGFLSTFSNVIFEWDETKAAKNLAKHGIGFAQAVVIFQDPHRLTAVDLRHAAEHRENTTGGVQGVVFTACHTDRAGVTRIISARYASRQERNKYHANH